MIVYFYTWYPCLVRGMYVLSYVIYGYNRTEPKLAIFRITFDLPITVDKIKISKAYNKLNFTNNDSCVVSKPKTSITCCSLFSYFCNVLFALNLKQFLSVVMLMLFFVKLLQIARHITQVLPVRESGKNYIFADIIFISFVSMTFLFCSLQLLSFYSWCC